MPLFYENYRRGPHNLRNWRGALAIFWMAFGLIFLLTALTVNPVEGLFGLLMIWLGFYQAYCMWTGMVPYWAEGNERLRRARRQRGEE